MTLFLKLSVLSRGQPAREGLKKNTVLFLTTHLSYAIKSKFSETHLLFG
jgi:hypothetical protein